MPQTDIVRQVLNLANKFTYVTGMSPNVLIVGPNADIDELVHQGKVCGMRVVADDMAPQDFAVAFTV